MACDPFCPWCHRQPELRGDAESYRLLLQLALSLVNDRDKQIARLREQLLERMGVPTSRD
jgi:hypothetical protein